MKTTSKVIVVSSIILVLSLGFLLMQILGYKGESISDIDLSNEQKSTIITTPTKAIDKYSPNECLYVLNGKIAISNYYKSNVTGTIKAKALVFDIIQNVENQKIKANENFFAETISISSMVNVGKQTYYENDKVVLRDASDAKNNKWNTKLTVYDFDNYIKEYGVDQRELTNYILNDDTIISSELVSSTNDEFVFKYKLDTIKATPFYKINMIKMGDLKSSPVFSSCEIIVTMKANFEPISIECIDKYNVAQFGQKIQCSSHLTETFSAFNDATITIPNEELFKNEL